jgi:1-acyl-sn-glycerol-3-phosphate acyltransferase
MQPLIGSDGSYRSAKNLASWWGKTFPTWTFYRHFLANVVRSSAQVQRGEYDGAQWARSSQEVLHALESVGVQFEITGINHLKQLTSPCLVVGNHMGMMETIVLPAILQPIRNVTFIVKASLLEYPFFKHIMRSRNPIAVSQLNPRLDLKLILEEGTDRLDRGSSVVAFPQGARTHDFSPSKFNTLGIKLAKRADVPIIPLALKTDAWGIGYWIKDFGKISPTKKVRFAFGEPLTIQGRGKEEQQTTIRFIEQHLKHWQEEDRASHEIR